jgi:hypothetical protein
VASLVALMIREAYYYGEKMGYHVIPVVKLV